MDHIEIDPKLLIQQELSKRCSRNPRYSMRSFARSMGLSHTVLSLVLSNKRQLSLKAAQKLANGLALNPMERDALFNSIQKKKNNKKSAEREEKKKAQTYYQISLDTFTLISEWYHYAILSLLKIRDSKFDAKWISKRLSISEIQAKIAMDRLVRLNMVDLSDGVWKQKVPPLKIENNISTAATKRFQKQLMEQAIYSLENDPFEERDHSSMTLAMNPALIPYARQRIRAFRRELAKELEELGTPKRVYNLTVQIYPVSRDEGDNHYEIQGIP